MFSSIRRIWRSYLASIPKPDDDAYVSDREIVREHFRTPSLSPEDRAAFDALSELMVSHLPEKLALSKGQQLKAKFKAGVPPEAAIARWIGINCGTQSQVGVIELDWKAREEVLWQASNLAKAHGITLRWTYDSQTDTEWEGWGERGEAPVDSPLRSLSRALLQDGLVLYRMALDDSVVAFAVKCEMRQAVMANCDALEVRVVAESQ